MNFKYKQLNISCLDIIYKDVCFGVHRRWSVLACD